MIKNVTTTVPGIAVWCNASGCTVCPNELNRIWSDEDNDWHERVAYTKQVHVDSIGNEVKEGDKIVYFTRKSSSIWKHTATITKLKDDGGAKVQVTYGYTAPFKVRNTNLASLRYTVKADWQEVGTF